MQCRKGCGACCIAPSITQPFYQMPNGKKAGEPCVHLDEARLCKIFDDPRRPDFCTQFQAEAFICQDTFEQAMITLIALDHETG